MVHQLRSYLTILELFAKQQQFQLSSYRRISDKLVHRSLVSKMRWWLFHMYHNITSFGVTVHVWWGVPSTIFLKSLMLYSDQMKAKYSVSRIPGRWTLCLFYTFLNIIAINAAVIYRGNLDNHENQEYFLRTLLFS